MEHFWVATDYLNRTCAWLAVSLAQSLSIAADQPISTKGWRFRFVWDDGLEQVKTDKPAIVVHRKKMAIINFKPEVYQSVETGAKEIAKALIQGFFEIENFKEDPLLTLFGTDDSVSDMLDMLVKEHGVLVRYGARTIDFVMPYDITNKTDRTNAELFLEITLDEADNLSDVIQ